jgi:hypothetical protein
LVVTVPMVWLSKASACAFGQWAKIAGVGEHDLAGLRRQRERA